ncbi:ribosomal biogenesis factor-like isoform X1 [Dreissena polymorpha]|uniref:Uncharacterized protein n=1 Tax=Dreissena polymorpha TaxID=45954 RepID=A0A9D4HBW0_DREPO|nr:ribosomal biogenesis factor-like [Dreissena polymorpha]XP_052246417.1 ribosomal biogenesis factor-like [Dreissena polymorpha]XP_052246418.1 ribosomal biogenesis factor-like [Dreissena polymorpha]XP_052246419.1 ribosomal biogenesis factor-like [Dreissena polymorpha]XP_052246421.1 ribosomal biogenesis factor-like [Dreissena polymorpha]XP_052246422.1 ribosomal biogenesis factor-like [Dreissena polymorpha]XP_052246423.1 ribosomal biogenesis factor-like [Dreissena polymorpha]XP_052246424.1 rib
MGKNKPKAQTQKVKQQKAFVVGTIKKAKTKPISSNLKKLNLQSTRAKTDKVDASFKEIRQQIQEAASASTEKPKAVASQGKSSRKETTKEPVDMDTATESFSKL